MIQEFTLRQARYQSRPQFAANHPQVMQAMIAEQLQLNIEMNCIEEYLREQYEADAHRQQIQDAFDGS